MRTIKLNSWVLLLILTFIFCLYSYYQLSIKQRYYQKSFIISKGQGIKGISKTIFKKDNLLQLAAVFQLYIESKISNKYVIPGEYNLSGSYSLNQITKKIISGDRVIRKIVIPEGYNIYQIKLAFEKAEGLVGSFPSNIEEGKLLPDTYYYFWGDLRSQVVKTMQDSMDKFLTKNFQTSVLIADRKRLLTLASIVEKETSVPQERARIAGVYLNRLSIGMILQADPTVIYGITNGQTDFNYKLTKVDLLQASPYNTYLIKGLPPTPIACPGKDSILAVINPELTKDLYFVADGDGKHNFARSLTEHNLNVKAYKEKRKLNTPK